MSKVTVLVGTKKGAFILVADGKRRPFVRIFAGKEALSPEPPETK